MTEIREGRWVLIPSRETHVRNSEEASARNSCETHGVLLQADRASVWQKTAYFWQYDMTQNIRKNTQLHFSFSCSPPTGYIESLENLDPVIRKGCSNGQKPRSVWLLKILKTRRCSKLVLTKVRTVLSLSESIKTFFLSREFIILRVLKLGW